MVRARMVAQREKKERMEGAARIEGATAEKVQREEIDREKKRVMIEQQRVELEKWKEGHREAQRKAAQARKDKAEADAKTIRLAAQKKKDKGIAEAKALEAAEQNKSDQEAEKATQLAAIQARIKRAAA